MFNSVKIGSLVAKNRIVLAPLTRSRCGADQVPKPWNVDYYTQRASAGLIVSEATVISPQGMGWAGSPGIYKDEHIAGWKAVTDAVHKKGGLIFAQLWHMGRSTHSSHHGLQPVGPSAIAIKGTTFNSSGKAVPAEVPKALELPEINGIVQEYKKAAARAKEAGFDGVELHGSNGYLLDQFLQSNSNTRTDKYGGNKENRFRFVGEVIDAVSQEMSSDRVAIRLGPNGAFNSMGSEENVESFSYFVSELSKKDLAYVHIIDGVSMGFHGKGRPFTLKDARANYKGTLIGNCGYTKETADAAFASGDADLISFGRPFITNPDLVERFRNGWPLAASPFDFAMWYGNPRFDPTKGYTDHPTYQAN